MGWEPFAVGNNESFRGMAENSGIFAGGLVGVEGVLCAKVVDAAGEVEGVDHVLRNLFNPGDATELPCCKAELGALADCLLEVYYKVVVVAHAGSGIVVHPGGAKCHAAAANLQCTLLGQQFVSAVVVLGSEWGIFCKKPKFCTSVIDLV